MKRLENLDSFRRAWYHKRRYRDTKRALCHQRPSVEYNRRFYHRIVASMQSAVATAMTNLLETCSLKFFVSKSMVPPPVFSFGPPVMFPHDGGACFILAQSSFAEQALHKWVQRLFCLAVRKNPLQIAQIPMKREYRVQDFIV